jgi:alkylation response protein AidB-like acyl-CoA dehydrogenase
MRFALSEEQRGFAGSLSEMLRRADTVAAARAWAAGDHEPGLTLWRRLADQGVCGLVVPEADGGLGATDVDLVVAHEALGHHVAVGPWLESVYLSGVLQGEALARLAEGELVTVCLPPVVPYALDADVAESVHLGTDRVAVGDLVASVDPTRRLFEVADGSGAVDVDATAFDRTVLACSAQLLGAGERILVDTVAYATQRTQFGRAIGSYQAIKHALADVRIALDFARPLLYAAALGEVPASAAKVVCGDAATRSARTGLQVHGAIGYTAEHDLGLWLTRVRALVGAWGDTEHHRARLGQQLQGAG